MSLQPVVLELTRAGLPVSCRANVVGGTAEKPALGVVLHLAVPACRHHRDAPFLGGEHTFTLRPSAALEPARQAVLAVAGEQQVRAMLTPSDAGLVASIDGQPVGDLPGDEAAVLAPLVVAGSDGGFAPECVAEVYANKKSTGLRLRTIDAPV